MSSRSHHVTGGPFEQGSRARAWLAGLGAGSGSTRSGRLSCEGRGQRSSPCESDEARVPSLVPSPCYRIISAARTTCTISATACTRTMWAPPSTAAVTAAAVGPVAVGGRRRRRRRRPGTTCATGRRAADGRARPAPPGRPARPRCARPAWRNPARVEHELVPRDAAAHGALDGAREIARHVGGDVAVAGVRVHVAGRPRMCISTSGAPRTATMSPRAGSYCSPLMSLTMLAPSSSPNRATSRLGGVDGERDAQAVQLAHHRQQPQPLLAAGQRRGARAGRLGADVEEVGAGRLHRQGEVERAAGIERTPPSENESGVTLSTPMTSVRAPSTSGARPASGSVNVARAQSCGRRRHAGRAGVGAARIIPGPAASARSAAAARARVRARRSRVSSAGGARRRRRRAARRSAGR